MSEELFEHPFDPYLYQREVIIYRAKQRTKGQLVRKFRQKEGILSPVIQTEVREGADDITEGIPYQINNVEEIVTDVQQYSGIRVTLLSAKADLGNVVLWQRKVTGTTSKLGVFILALGANTDKWLNKWIIFRQWQPRQRVIEVIPAPVPKAAKATKITK